MSTHETELINIIRNSSDPEKTVLTAIEIFTAFLEQLSEDQGLPVVYPLESA